MHGEAPSLLGWNCESEIRHCIVVKQPTSAVEVDCMLSAMFVSDIDSLRYRGSNPEIIDRIAIIGHSALLDLSPQVHGGSNARSHASFSVKGGWFPASTQILVESITHHFTDLDPFVWSKWVAKAVIISRDLAIIRLTVWPSIHHIVELRRLGKGKWLATTAPNAKHIGAWRGLSRMVEAWLQSDQRVHNVRWFAADEWAAGAPGHLAAV